MKNKFLIALLLIFTLSLSGCTKAPVNSNPTVQQKIEQNNYVGTEIFDGVYYDEQQIQTKDNKNVNTFVLTISKANNNLEVAAGVPDDTTPLEPGVVQTTTTQAMCAESNGKYVIAAINADYFHMDDNEKIQPCSVTIKDGQKLTEFKKSRWDRDCFFGIKNDGTAVLGDESVYKDVEKDLYQAVGGGPWLIKDGAVTGIDDNSRHPRTAVGILEDGSVIMVVADGRRSKTVGFSYSELAEYMLSLGCIEAVNLDGGGSTTMAIKIPDEKDPAFDYFEVKNNPSDNLERPVGNTLLIIDTSKTTNAEE